MPEQFLHGVEVIQTDDGIRPIRTVKSSVIGLVGTAPDADADEFPENTPLLIEGPRKAALLGDTRAQSATSTPLSMGSATLAAPWKASCPS